MSAIAIHHSFRPERLNQFRLSYDYSMPLRLLLAEDHKVVRQGLRAILQQEGLEVVAEAADGREASKLCDERPPDVVVLGISEPLMNGMDAARQIVKRHPGIKVVLLIQHRDDGFVMEAIRAGISGCVLKEKAAAELVTAIREVCQGGLYLGSGTYEYVVTICFPMYTPRELD
jgi:DNA-binding NarL/FixJ family response regulator